MRIKNPAGGEADCGLQAPGLTPKKIWRRSVGNLRKRRRGSGVIIWQRATRWPVAMAMAPGLPRRRNEGFEFEVEDPAAAVLQVHAMGCFAGNGPAEDLGKYGLRCRPAPVVGVVARLWVLLPRLLAGGCLSRFFSPWFIIWDSIYS